MHIHRSERAWLWFGVATLVVFLGLIGFAAIADGIQPPSHSQTIDPTKVAQTPPFDHPGVRPVGDRAVEAYFVARYPAFSPSSITVAAGTEVTFYVTSPDVVHGFFVEGTDVNLMVIPGWVSSASHRFTTPGTYLLLCNEFCGVDHHFMYGSIEVK